MNIAAVVVTYNPSIEALSALLQRLQPQVTSVIVVDNSSGKGLGQALKPHLAAHTEVISLGYNSGIARAQNFGIERARLLGAQFVTLFDQDSLPAPDMVRRLYAFARSRVEAGERLAAVGPQFTDSRNRNQTTFLRVGLLMAKKIRCNPGDQALRLDTVIASGSLIPLDTIDQIGGMDEDLFIDQVDIEWCLRAVARGYSTYGLCSAKMEHSLGETPINLLGMKFSRHKPVRYYYIARNTVSLLGRPYIPFGWKFKMVRMLLFRSLLNTLLVAPRIEYLKMILTGIWHAVTGRKGPLS